MFTLMIHCLEVLAMHSEGATVAKIVSMGCEYSNQTVSACLRNLEKEGMVKRWKAGRTTVWSITDKAVEYCHTVVSKHEKSHEMDEISEINAAQAQMTPDEVAVDSAMRTAMVTVNEVHKGWKTGPDDGKKVRLMLAVQRLFGEVVNRQCELNFNVQRESFPRA